MATRRKIQRTKGYDFVPIGEAFTEFITEKEVKNLSPSTISNYKLSFELFMRFHNFDDGINPNEIEPQHFFKWMHTLKLEGKSFTSINHYLRDCRTFFYWMMDEQRSYIDRRFKIQMMEGQQETHKMFSDDDIEALLIKPLRTANYVEWRTWAVVNFVLATGCRASTIIDVLLGDIDFKNKTIILRHTKNKKPQILPLSTSLASVLKDYIRMWRTYIDDVGTQTDQYDYLFSNINQEQLTTNALKHSFAKYCEGRGVEHTNIHGLRHNFAKMWVTNNGSMAKLQKVLGHSSLEMSRRYVKLYGEDLKDDYDKFSPLDNIKRTAKRTQTMVKNS